MENLNKFIIITVCYNAQSSIEKTINSVIAQTYKNYEYLIIDGNSKDRTVKIAKDYEYLDNVTIISEDDRGIYDAMNKGLSLCNDGIVYFLNAGDEFFDDNVLRDVNEEYNNNKDLEVLYGNVVQVKDFSQTIIRQDKFDKKKLLNGKMICHQSIFSKKEVFYKVGVFDIKYRLCADYEWLIKCYFSNLKIKHFEKTIANYNCDGLTGSGRNRKLIWHEREKIVKTNIGRINAIKLRISQRYILRINNRLNIIRGKKNG